jgi:cytochrome c peroxidase
MQVTSHYALINSIIVNKTLNIGLIELLCALSILLPSAFVHSSDAISPAEASSIYLDTKQELKIQLGKQLFEDPSLSNSGQMACSTCHQANMGFSDGRSFSLDNQGNPLPYNTPTVQYVAYNYYFGWTARFPRLQDHLDALMINPKLMNRDWLELSQQVEQNDHYNQLFQNAGYDEISRNSISDAIIQYEYSLAKFSRYDLYLLGDKQQFTETEQQGYSLFKEFGCTSCHQGKNLGGNLRQKFGLMKPYFSKKTKIQARDFGYYTTTLQDEDRFYFRVPSLRNVSNTPPYFHDGSATTLAKAIEVMFVHQLGIKPSGSDISLIETFLHTLEPIE